MPAKALIPAAVLTETIAGATILTAKGWIMVPTPVYGSVDGPVHYPDHPFPMLQQRIIAGIRKFHWGLDNKF